MSDNATYKVKVYFGLLGLEKLKPEWTKLLQNVKNRMYSHSHQWYRAYLNYLSEKPRDFMFYAVYKQGELVGIIPLENTQHSFSCFKFWVLSLPLHYHFGLKDFVISKYESSEAIFSACLEFLRTCSNVKWDLVFLQGVLIESSAGKCLSPKITKLQFRSGFASCDVLPIRAYEEINSEFSKNFRGALRKARNKLQKHKIINFKTSCSRNELIELYGQFLDVESSGWKGEAGTQSAIKLNDKLKAFYLDSVVGFSAEKEAEISILEVDGMAIAGHLSFVIDNVAYLLKIGFDEKFAKLAPGNMLLEHKLKQYYEQGNVKSINLITDAKWHHSWKPNSLPTINYYVCNASLGGIKFAVLYGIKTYLFENKKIINAAERILRIKGKVRVH